MNDLEKLLENGKKNGVDLRLLTGEEVKKIEPELDCYAAMYCKHTGVTSPYEYAIALAENAIFNGVEILLSHEVVSIKKEKEKWVVECVYNKGKSSNVFKTDVVINCAGLESAKIAQMVTDLFFEIIPRKGEYLLLDKSQAHLVRHVLFPVPNDKGKGILVSPTYWGNVLLGPTSRPLTELLTNTQVLESIIKNALKLVPSLDISHAITSYVGYRAKSSTKDFIVEENPSNFLHFAGIDSPGLTSSPALALLALEKLKQIFAKLGKLISLNINFNPSRPSIIIPKQLSFKGSIDSKDPGKNIICRCERITESEIIEAMRRPLAPKTFSAVKRRTRAGMGVCQGKFCEERVVKIISREMDIPEVLVAKYKKGSSLLPNLRVTEEDRSLLKSLANKCKM